MSTSTIIILVVVVVCLAFVAYGYHHKKNHHYHIAGLQVAVDKIFSQAHAESMRRNDFLRALDRYYNCSRKESLYLLGYAREHGIVKTGEQVVTKV